MMIYSNIVKKMELREVQSRTLAEISNALANSFGPYGSTTCYRQNKNIPKYTKDGHTILKNLNFQGCIETSIRDDLEAITRRIITTVGDGTTSAIILSRYIFDGLLLEAVDQEQKDGTYTKGKSEHKLIKDLKYCVDHIIKTIMSQKRECTLDDIYDIALIATNNNEFMAEDIKQIYKESGMDVYIDVGTSNSTDTVIRRYDGFTINSGYGDVSFVNNSEKHICEIPSPKLYIFEDPIDTPEMTTYMQKILYDNIFLHSKNPEAPLVPTVIFTPRIGADVNASMDALVKYLMGIQAEARLDYAPVCVVTNINDSNYLADLAFISGAKLISKYINPKQQEEDQKEGKAVYIRKNEETGLIETNIHEFAGTADKFIADSMKSKIINPSLMYDENHEYTEVYKNRLADMESQLEGMLETRESDSAVNVMRRRIYSFKSNLVELLVGGISDTDRDNLKDAVDDAVLNCRSAAIDGVGYGANFEAFRAINSLIALSYRKEDFPDPLKYEEFANRRYMFVLLGSAYLMLLQHLYYEEEDTKDIITKSIDPEINKPFNIRTRQYDGKVLTSIKTDPIILDAIVKIIGLVFETNQFLTPTFASNQYTAVKEAMKDDSVQQGTNQTKDNNAQSQTKPPFMSNHMSTGMPQMGGFGPMMAGLAGANSAQALSPDMINKLAAEAAKNEQENNSDKDTETNQEENKETEVSETDEKE